MDKVSAQTRSRTMRAVGRKDTAPEMVVRRLLHRLDYRYRIHDKSLPGSPDIVFTNRKKVIFVNGCFWHAHSCRESLTPKSRSEFWKPKLTRNKERDQKNTSLLQSMGWEVLTVWECETKKDNVTNLTHELVEFLGPSRFN